MRAVPWLRLRGPLLGCAALLLQSCGGDGEFAVGFSSGSVSGTGFGSGLTLAITSSDDPYWCAFNLVCPAAYPYAYPYIPFRASLRSAPAPDAVLSGIVRLEVRGNGLSSVVLFAGTSTTPLAVFDINSDGTFARLDLNTRTLPNGPLTARISAYNLVQGQASALEIVVMAPRTWTIQN